MAFCALCSRTRTARSCCAAASCSALPPHLYLPCPASAFCPFNTHLHALRAHALLLRTHAHRAPRTAHALRATHALRTRHTHTTRTCTHTHLHTLTHTPHTHRTTYTRARLLPTATTHFGYGSLPLLPFILFCCAMYGWHDGPVRVNTLRSQTLPRYPWFDSLANTAGLCGPAIVD